MGMKAVGAMAAKIITFLIHLLKYSYDRFVLARNQQKTHAPLEVPFPYLNCVEDLG